MANRFLGEVKAQGAGKPYTLRIDMNAMAHFEGETGKNAIETMQKAEGGAASIKDLRQIIHSALQRHHPDATISDAGDILSEDMDVLKSLFDAARPKPAEDSGNLAPAPQAG